MKNQEVIDQLSEKNRHVEVKMLINGKPYPIKDIAFRNKDKKMILYISSKRLNTKIPIESEAGDACKNITKSSGGN